MNYSSFDVSTQKQVMELGKNLLAYIASSIGLWPKEESSRYPISILDDARGPSFMKSLGYTYVCKLFLSDRTYGTFFMSHNGREYVDLTPSYFGFGARSNDFTKFEKVVKIINQAVNNGITNFNRDGTLSSADGQKLDKLIDAEFPANGSGMAGGRRRRGSRKSHKSRKSRRSPLRRKQSTRRRR